MSSDVRCHFYQMWTPVQVVLPWLSDIPCTVCASWRNVEVGVLREVQFRFGDLCKVTGLML